MCAITPTPPHPPSKMVFDAGTERDESVRRKDGFYAGTGRLLARNEPSGARYHTPPPPHPPPEDVTFAL